MKTNLLSSSNDVRQQGPVRRGFTVVELLVVIGVVGVTAGLLLPSVSGAARQAGTVACLNNLKQLQACWLMYAGDHQDVVPPNLSSNHHGIWRSTADSWIGNSNARLDRDARAIQQGLLFRYDYNRVVAHYRCPSDDSRVQAVRGASTTQARTRSYSMSGCLGGRESEDQAVVQRVVEVPVPSRLFVFVDEHEDSIDDAHFLTWPKPQERWVNLPSGRHARGANLSFVDGHVERWRWQAGKKFEGLESYWKPCAGVEDLADLRRLQDATLPVSRSLPWD